MLLKFPYNYQEDYLWIEALVIALETKIDINLIKLKKIIKLILDSKQYSNVEMDMVY